MWILIQFELPPSRGRKSWTSFILTSAFWQFTPGSLNGARFLQINRYQSPRHYISIIIDSLPSVCLSRCVVHLFEHPADALLDSQWSCIHPRVLGAFVSEIRLHPSWGDCGGEEEEGAEEEGEE